MHKKTMNQVAEYVQKLSIYLPSFASYWESEDAAFNFGESSSIHGVFADFSHLVIAQLQAGSLNNPAELFTFIESIIEGGGDPANAACTCFLENILNRVPSSLSPDRFTSYLGPKSKAFCVAWDNFTGIKTNGLHDNA